MVAGYRGKGATTMAATDDLDRVIEQYHQALDEFSRGNPDPVKEFYSGRDDVAIANPFFPLTRGREQVVERLERSVRNFSDGEWRSRLHRGARRVEGQGRRQGGRHAFHFAGYDPLSGRRRRLEGVHRHADPITTPQPTESVIQE
jgi:hypothetical protein